MLIVLCKAVFTFLTSWPELILTYKSSFMYSAYFSGEEQVSVKQSIDNTTELQVVLHLVF